jgi:two-component system sensor histidine kinase BarA
MMPKLSGLEATKQIRLLESQNDNKRIPIAAMTANNTLLDREECLQAGMDSFIAKVSQ